MAPDTKLFWVNKAGERFDDMPSSWKPVKRYSSAQVSTAPEATLPSFEASIPGTLDDDHTQTSNNESLKHRANFDVPKSPNANTQPVQETSSKKSPRSEEVATRPLTKEVSIANILQSVLGESDVQVVHMPPKSMTKEASIANILSDALCDATVVNHRPVQYRPTPSMTKGASIANILKNALGDDATTVVHAQPHVLTKEVSIANILRNALDDEDERGSAAAISKAPQTLSKEASIAHIITSALEDSDVSTVVPSTRLRDFEIGAAVAHLNAPLDIPQPTNRSGIDVPPLLQNSRSSRRMDQLESQGSTLSRGLNTSPSKAELVPSASRAELNRLLSESQASSPGTSADTMAGTSLEAMHSAPIKARPKRATFNHGSAGLPHPTSLSQHQQPLMANGSSRHIRMSVPGGERNITDRGDSQRLNSFPVAASDGGSHASRSELNRILLETQREVQSVGGNSDVSLCTPVLPKLLPVRTNARASFTRSSQEQASSILQTTTRLQSSTRTSFRQARLSNADVETLISGSRGGLAPSSSKAALTPSRSRADLNPLMLAEQQGARQAQDVESPSEDSTRSVADGSGDSPSVVGLMRVSPSKANLLAKATQLEGNDLTTVQSNVSSRSRLDPPTTLQNSSSRSSRSFRQSRMQSSELQRSSTGLRGMNTSPSKAVLVPSESRAELNRLLLAAQHTAADPSSSARMLTNDDSDGNPGVIGLMRTSPSKAVLVPSESRAELNRFLLADQHAASTADENTGFIGLMRTSPSKAVLVPSESRAELNRLLLEDQHTSSTADENTGFIGLMRTSPSKAVLVPSESRAELNRLLLADQHAAAALPESSAASTSPSRSPTLVSYADSVMSVSQSRGNIRAGNLSSRQMVMHSSPSRSFRQNRTQDPERDMVQRSNTGLRGLTTSPSKAELVPSASRAALTQLLIADKLATAVQEAAANPTDTATSAASHSPTATDSRGVEHPSDLGPTESRPEPIPSAPTDHPTPLAIVQGDEVPIQPTPSTNDNTRHDTDDSITSTGSATSVDDAMGSSSSSYTAGHDPTSDLKDHKLSSHDIPETSSQPPPYSLPASVLTPSAAMLGEEEPTEISPSPDRAPPFDGTVPLGVDVACSRFTAKRLETIDSKGSIASNSSVFASENSTDETDKKVWIVDGVANYPMARQSSRSSIVPSSQA
ncbi:hypothetical protein DYB25_001975 [Aphanomyces astaci]|uniref:Uncharacterized protein n=1 Tax=Aphanomyces astaci TaxID=112090 RepID=A0A397BMZ2_APHAT|nr:hypothetical protein DYB25_001975 [Aphanomyces astaci]